MRKSSPAAWLEEVLTSDQTEFDACECQHDDDGPLFLTNCQRAPLRAVALYTTGGLAALTGRQDAASVLLLRQLKG